MFFKLNGDQRLTMRCASENCRQQVTHKMESGVVGSYYCGACVEKIKEIWPDGTEFSVGDEWMNPQS